MKWFYALILALALSPLLTDIPVLGIYSEREGKVLWGRIVQPGDEFTLQFTHSVEGSAVRDTFKIDSEFNLVLQESRFASLNAGLPAAVSGEESIRLEDGSFRVSGYNRVLPLIDLWAQEKYGNSLKLQSREVNLARLAGDGLLRISVRKEPFGMALLRYFR